MCSPRSRGVPVPEPSPLFWDAFAARVSDAIDRRRRRGAPGSPAGASRGPLSQRSFWSLDRRSVGALPDLHFHVGRRTPVQRSQRRQPGAAAIEPGSTRLRCRR